MQEPQILLPPTANSSSGGAYVFIFGSPSSQSRMLALTEGLRKEGVEVQVAGESRFCKCSGASVDHGHLTQMIRSAKSLIVCVDDEFIRRVNAFDIGDHLVTGFTVAKTLEAKQLLVVVSEPALVNAEAWGWSPLFARLSHLEVVDLSMDQTTEAWAKMIKHVAGWCMDPATRGAQGEAIEGPSADLPCQVDWCSGLVREREADRGFRSPWLWSRHHRRGRCYDVFLTHNWGPDEQGRDNHLRATKIAMFLRRHGLEVFLDDWEMARYRNIDEAMVLGMQYSSCVVILLTRRYIEKVSQGQVYDNCVAEFNLSRLVPGTIVAVMENELKNPGKWGYNAIFGQLSSHLYVDMTADSGHLIEMFQCGRRGMAVQRWWCSLDALEIRIRTETAMIEGLAVRQRPMPFVPHRDNVVFMSGVFALAASLDAAVFACIAAGVDLRESVLSALRFVSWLCWATGFCVQAFTQFLYSRKPPHFNVHWAEIPWAIVISIAIKCVSAAVGLCSVFLNQEASAAATTFAFGLLFVGNFLNLLAVGFIWRNSEHGIAMHALASFRNLPHWGVFALAAASVANLSGNILKRGDEGREGGRQELSQLLCNGAGSGLMLASAALYLTWALTSNRALARYFRGALRRSEQSSSRVLMRTDSSATGKEDPGTFEL